MRPTKSKGRGSFSIATRAIQSYLITIRRMPLLVGSTLAVAVLVEFGIAAAAAALPADYQFLTETRNAVTRSFSLDQFLLAKLFEFPTIVVRAIVFAPLAVATHRLIVLNEVTPGYISLAPTRTQRFILWAVLIQLVLIVPSLLRQPSQPSLAVVALSVALLIISIVVCVRLTLIFPAIAIESGNQNWDRTWQLTRGHFWRIALPFLYVFLPFLGIAGLVLFWRAGTFSAAGLAAFAQEQKYQPLFTQSPDILMKAVGGTVFTGLGAAVASWLYVVLLQQAPSANQSGVPS